MQEERGHERWLFLSRHLKALRRHAETCATRRRSARNRYFYPSCLGSSGHGCLHLRVRLHSESRCLHAAKGDLGGLLKSDSIDGHLCSVQAAGWTEARDPRHGNGSCAAECAGRLEIGLADIP